METSQLFWQSALLLEHCYEENSFPYTQYESLLYCLCLLSLILPPISVKNLALPLGAFTVTGLFLPRWRVCIDPYWSFWPFSLSRPLWLVGLPTSYRQMAAGNWWPLKTWQKHAPSSSRSLVKVTNRTGPSRCWSTALVRCLWVCLGSVSWVIQFFEFSIHLLSTLSIENVMSHTTQRIV